MVVKVDGIKMYLDSQDNGICRDLILNPNREELGQVILKKLKPTDKVVDIGANIGFYALKERRIVGNLGKVYAIEPAEKTCYWLKKNLSENGYRNVEVDCLALGDKTKEVEIYISTKSNLNNLVNAYKGPTTRVQKVKMDTLDNFSASKKFKPTFIRMDVEGYEYNIIKGARNIMAKSKDLRLMIEIHPFIMGRKKTADFLKIMKNSRFESTIVVFENGFYPYVKVNSRLRKFLTYLWGQFTEKDTHILNKVHFDMSIDDMLKNKDILNGRYGCPHVLFEKKE